MLAVSKGILIALSTPWGKRGWFHEEWTGITKGRWKRFSATAFECPRISPEFLEEERAALGERWFRQEYLCSFEDTMDAVFSSDDVAAAMNTKVKPLWSA
jgi:hypothetical protein